MDVAHKPISSENYISIMCELSKLFFWEHVEGYSEVLPS